MRHKRIFAVTAATLLLATFASAQLFTFNDPIDQSQAVPPSGSPAVGTAVGTYNAGTNTLNITATASGFVSPITGAHIHGPAPVGGIAGIIFDLGVGGVFPNYSNVNSVWVMTGAQEIDFLGGLHYVNIHTMANPGGDIRGQLNPVPEPASMIALAAGSVLLLRRRKRLIK